MPNDSFELQTETECFFRAEDQHLQLGLPNWKMKEKKMGL